MPLQLVRAAQELTPTPDLSTAAPTSAAVPESVILPIVGPVAKSTLEAMGSIGDFLSGIGSVVTAVGLVFTVVVVWLTWRQAKVAQEAASASVYQSMVATTNHITEMMLRDLSLHQAIYGPPDTTGQTGPDPDRSIRSRLRSWINGPDDRRPLPEDPRSRETRAYLLSSIILDHFEFIVAVKPLIPRDRRPYWEMFIGRVVSNSKPLQHCLAANPWYSDELRAVVKAAAAAPPTGPPTAAGDRARPPPST